MLNNYLSNLNRVEFMVTMACTGACKHCSEGEHLMDTESLSPEQSVNALRDICRHYDIESIMTFGGEPLLMADTVCQLHAEAKKLEIPNRQLITNGYFTKNKEKARSIAHKLADSGVNNILLSVDAFHQETIPLDHVLSFAEIMLKENVLIRTHPAWLVSTEDTNPYNERTKEILSECAKLGMKSTSGNIIFPSGNALKYLSEYFDPTQNYTNPYVEDPTDVRSICIASNGDVLNGNINQTPIMDVLKSYTVSV